MIQPLLPTKMRGKPRVDDRRVLSRIIFCIRRSYRWSDVPAEYGPAKTLHIGKTKGGLNSKLHLVCDGATRFIWA